MRVDVSAQRLVIPQFCACCGGPPEAICVAMATGTPNQRASFQSWEFPYCNACFAHVQSARAAKIPGIIVGILGALVGTVIAMKAGNFAAFIVFALFGLIGGVLITSKLKRDALSMCSRACACPNESVYYLGWYAQCHSFDFASLPYAFHFMKANQDKLVNVAPDVWNWLHGGNPPNLHQSAQRFIT